MGFQTTTDTTNTIGSSLMLAYVLYLPGALLFLTILYIILRIKYKYITPYKQVGIQPKKYGPDNDGLVWSNVSVSAGKKLLLNNVWGYAKRGRVTAIVASSGAGKSTLLNVLGFRKDARPGAIMRVDGQVYNAAYCRKSVGYVEQQGVFYKHLTVEDSLHYAAEMTYVPNLSQAWWQARRAMFNADIEHKRHTKIERLSGGEKRRMAVAEQLLTDPDVLLLDEPTSGLDASGAAELMRSFARMKQQNKVVLIVLHQPSPEIWAGIDDLIVLKKNRDGVGELVYCGKRVDPPTDSDNPQKGILAPSFDFSRPEDIFNSFPKPTADVLEIRQKDRVQRGRLDKRLANSLWERVLRPRLAAPLQLIRGMHLWWALDRNKFFVLTILRPLLVSLFLGMSFPDLASDQTGAQDRIGVTYFLTNLVIVSEMPHVTPFSMYDCTIFYKEYRQGLVDILPFMAAKWTRDLFRHIIESTIMLIMFAWVGFRWNNDQTAAVFVGNLVLIAEVASSLLTCAAVFFKGHRNSHILGNLLIVWMSLYSGYFVNRDNMNPVLRPMMDISLHRYGFQALLWNEMDGHTFSCKSSEQVLVTAETCSSYGATPVSSLCSSTGVCPIPSGNYLMESFHISEVPKFMYDPQVALILMVVFWRTLTVILLTIRVAPIGRSLRRNIKAAKRSIRATFKSLNPFRRKKKAYKQGIDVWMEWDARMRDLFTISSDSSSEDSSVQSQDRTGNTHTTMDYERAMKKIQKATKGLEWRHNNDQNLKDPESLTSSAKPDFYGENAPQCKESAIGKTMMMCLIRDICGEDAGVKKKLRDFLPEGSMVEALFISALELRGHSVDGSLQNDNWIRGCLLELKNVTEDQRPVLKAFAEKVLDVQVFRKVLEKTSSSRSTSSRRLLRLSKSTKSDLGDNLTLDVYLEAAKLTWAHVALMDYLENGDNAVFGIPYLVEKLAGTLINSTHFYILGSRSRDNIVIFNSAFEFLSTWAHYAMEKRPELCEDGMIAEFLYVAFIEMLVSYRDIIINYSSSGVIEIETLMENAQDLAKLLWPEVETLTVTPRKSGSKKLQSILTTFGGLRRSASFSRSAPPPSPQPSKKKPRKTSVVVQANNGIHIPKIMKHMGGGMHREETRINIPHE